MKVLGYNLILKVGEWRDHALCEVPTEYLIRIPFILDLTPEELYLVDEELRFRND